MDCMIHLFYLINSVTLYTILKNQKFFIELVLDTHKVSTITGIIQKIEGSRRAYIMLPNSTHIFIKEYYF